MPVADPAFGWQEAVSAFAIIVVAAFLGTWVLTDRLRIWRAPTSRCQQWSKPERWPRMFVSSDRA
jgi:hypothetical protein